MRRSAVLAVQQRVLNQTLYALTKLTDLANTQPVSKRRQGVVQRPSKHDVLAGSVFSSPPILPFVQLEVEHRPLSLAEPPEDWTPAATFCALRSPLGVAALR